MHEPTTPFETYLRAAQPRFRMFFQAQWASPTLASHLRGTLIFFFCQGALCTGPKHTQRKVEIADRLPLARSVNSSLQAADLQNLTQSKYLALIKPKLEDPGS